MFQNKKVLCLKRLFIYSLISNKRKSSHEEYRSFLQDKTESKIGHDIETKIAIGSESFVSWVIDTVTKKTDCEETDLPTLKAAKTIKRRDLVLKITRDIDLDKSLKRKFMAYYLRKKTGLKLKEIAEILSKEFEKDVGASAVNKIVRRLEDDIFEEKKLKKLKKQLDVQMSHVEV